MCESKYTYDYRNKRALTCVRSDEHPDNKHYAPLFGAIWYWNTTEADSE